MPDRNRRTNLLLLLVMVLICTGCALLFRQSTAYPSKVEGGTVRLFASEDTEKPEADNGSSKTDVSERFHLQPLQQLHQCRLKFRRKQKKGCGLPAEATGCLW